MDDTRAGRWRALIGISILSIVVFIDFTVVNTILPGIQRDLNASVDDLQWVMNAFILMLTTCMVTAGRMGDIYGRRMVLYIGAIVFTAASLVAGMAESTNLLIACRFLQGAAGAITLTCGAALVTHHFPESESSKALAIFMSITGFGMAVGPVLGGLLLSFLSWRWAFYVNVPMVIIGFAIAWGAVSETPRQTDEKLDWLGLALFTPGMIAIVTFIMKGNNWGWDAPASIAMVAAGIAFLAAFVIVENRVKSPILDFKLFRIPLFLACNIMALAIGAFIGLGFFLPSLYLQVVRNEIPYIAGLMLLPISALVVIIPPLIGDLAEKNGPVRFIMTGLIFLVAAALAQSFFAPDSPALFVLFGLGLFGLGWGLMQATSTFAATSALPAAMSGLAIGVLYTVWNIGSSIGLAVGGLILEERDKASLDAGLAQLNITLDAKDQDLVRSVLSDPSQANNLLGELAPGLEDKILPLFKDAFMAGYSGAMWFLFVFCLVCSIAFAAIVRADKSKQKPAQEQANAA